MLYLSGRPFPLGSKLTNLAGKIGANFAIFSGKATAIELCLFDSDGNETRIPMTSTDDIWHIFVEGVQAGQKYGYRVYGEVNIETGSLFNPYKLLVDPYARAIEGHPDLSSKEKEKWFNWKDLRDNAHIAPKSIVVDNEFDWEGDVNPFINWHKTIIYETHIKGFSKLNPKVPAEIAGTFAGMAHSASIKHLKRLGITAVELQPITYHIDEPHLQHLGLVNYWGYNVLGHFAVDPKLAANKDNPLIEFKQMVKALHAEGIEVIMDVVFNHTAEGGANGATLCQRGIDNEAYYWMTDNSDYMNWSGCGNTLNVYTPAVLRWVIDCLCYWVEKCHVDGFRFDLAAVLGRTPAFSERAAFFSAIQSNSKLAHIKLIAEPWDIGWGGYQLGGFPKPFSEWNDRYRDDMRRFFLRNSGDLGTFARRFAGSDDIFAHYRQPSNSINFITAHDGFNLQDLVSYNDKHNWANGEDNRDGHGNNHSYNHGVEGKTHAKAVNFQREMTARAMLATLLLSAGIPMIFAGDEMGHSQQGNNNCYCQDNEITWLDWQSADQSRIKYVAKLISLRKRIPLLFNQNKWWRPEEVKWLNPNGIDMQINDWHNHESNALGILFQQEWLVLVNAKRTKQSFKLPQINGSHVDWEIVLGPKILGTLMTDAQIVTLEHIGVCVLQKSDLTHT